MTSTSYCSKLILLYNKLGKVSKCTILESEKKYKLKHKNYQLIYLLFLLYFLILQFIIIKIFQGNNTLTEGITAVLLFVENNAMETGFIN